MMCLKCSTDIARMIKYPGRNLRSRKNFAIRCTSSSLGKIVCALPISLGDISNRNLLSFANNRFISPLVSFILYCFRCDWVGDAFTRIFLDPRRCVTAGSNILSTANRLIYPTDQKAVCKLSPNVFHKLLF